MAENRGHAQDATPVLDMGELCVMRTARSDRRRRGSPQSGSGRVRRGHRLDHTGSAAAAVPDIQVGEETRKLMIFWAGESELLTAPIRNETPRYPRLTGTKTPAFGASPQWITKNPHLKHFLKTIENRLPNQPDGPRP